MFSKRCSVAIDIGSRLTKVVLGRREMDSILISGCGVCDIPSNSNSDFGCCQLIAESILNIIEDVEPKPRNVLVGVNGQNIITRNIKLPIIREKYLHEATLYEIKKYMPLNTDEYIISQKINNISEDDKCLDVLVVAVPKKTINFYLNIVNMLGLPIKLIDIFADSLADFFKVNVVQRNPLILLDIGHSHTEIILLEDGKLFFQKVLNIGCRDINSYDCDSARFEDKTALDNIVYNVSSVIDFYASSRPWRRIDSIFIYGGGSSIKGIKDYISSMMDVDTLLFDGKRCSVSDKNKLIDNYGVFLNCLSLLFKA